MKRSILAAIIMFIIMALTGCGDDHGHEQGQAPIVTDIFSDPVLDGYIVQNPLGVFTVTQGMTQTVQSVFAGIDPATPIAEYRAFLDFPLTDIPVNATIKLAILDIVIKSIQPQTGTIPIRIDLVKTQSQTLVAEDYSTDLLQALATITIPNLQPDSSGHFSVDVTSLMRKAQDLVLLNFQIRIMLDLTAVSGRIEIDDTTVPADRGALAPLLQVTHF